MSNGNGTALNENARKDSSLDTRSDSARDDHSHDPASDETHGLSQSESDSEDDNRQEYLVAVDYENDAERKRIEYLLSNRSDITVEKLRGLVRLVHTETFDEFYEELSAKVDDLNHLRVNELSAVDVTPEEKHERFTIETEVSREKVNWAFNTIERKRDATLEDREYEDEYGYHQYVTTTKSGTARYSYEMTKHEGMVYVDVHIWGYGGAPETLREFIENELNYAI